MKQVRWHLARITLAELISNPRQSINPCFHLLPNARAHSRGASDVQNATDVSSPRRVQRDGLALTPL